MAGNHGFQFDYTLPRDLPSSYEGRWGSVKYSVKATLSRPGRFDIERDAELTVSAHLDLNDDTDFARPIGGLGEFNPGLMCFRSGPIGVELRVHRRGYVSGDRIQLSADVENTSAYKLRRCRIALMQHVTYRSGRKLRKTTTCVTAVDKDDVLPRTTAHWHNDSVAVPDDLPPSSMKSQRNIDIRYTLAVVMRYSRWSTEFSLPVTVVIGTVPLRRHRVNSYLTVMFSGHSALRDMDRDEQLSHN